MSDGLFTKDLFQYYGGKEKYGERGGVWFARRDEIAHWWLDHSHEWKQ